MAKDATLSTLIDAGVKEAVTRFCRERGLKLRYLIEAALVEQLEDAADLEAYHSRQHEQKISLAKAVNKIKKKRGK